MSGVNIDQNLKDRFFAKVKIVKESKNTSGQRDCWEWEGAKDGGGYGIISSNRQIKTPYKAHRISWMIHWGDIPKGLHVLHSCDNPKCVNPHHLMIGSHKANMIDKSLKGKIPNNSIENLRR